MKALNTIYLHRIGWYNNKNIRLTAVDRFNTS